MPEQRPSTIAGRAPPSRGLALLAERTASRSPRSRSPAAGSRPTRRPPPPSRPRAAPEPLPAAAPGRRRRPRRVAAAAPLPLRLTPPPHRTQEILPNAPHQIHPAARSRRRPHRRRDRRRARRSQARRRDCIYDPATRTATVTKDDSGANKLLIKVSGGLITVDSNRLCVSSGFDFATSPTPTGSRSTSRHQFPRRRDDRRVRRRVRSGLHHRGRPPLRDRDRRAQGRRHRERRRDDHHRHARQRRGPHRQGIRQPPARPPGRRRPRRGHRHRAPARGPHRPRRRRKRFPVRPGLRRAAADAVEHHPLGRHGRRHDLRRLVGRRSLRRGRQRHAAQRRPGRRTS